VAVETGVAAGVMAGVVMVVGAEEEMGKAVAVALARAVVVVHLLRWRLY
jgi:NAD(P)-dependent dehydrogenase (short-subunit alcohol dehydrogenase family)